MEAGVQLGSVKSQSGTVCCNGSVVSPQVGGQARVGFDVEEVSAAAVNYRSHVASEQKLLGVELDIRVEERVPGPDTIIGTKITYFINSKPSTLNRKDKMGKRH
jgi:hypothetical protein